MIFMVLHCVTGVILNCYKAFYLYPTGQFRIHCTIEEQLESKELLGQVFAKVYSLYDGHTGGTKCVSPMSNYIHPRIFT